MKKSKELAVIVFVTWNKKDNSRKMTVHLSSRSSKKEWVEFECVGFFCFKPFLVNGFTLSSHSMTDHVYEQI